jgi:hypothetical protein
MFSIRKLLIYSVDFRYKHEIKLAGILYFQRITDNRATGTPLENLRLFEKLCGKHMFGNIILTTTMWDRIDDEIGQEREKELRGQYWRSMIELGSTTVRYRNTRDSAREILDRVLQGGLNRHALLMEMDASGPVYPASNSSERSKTHSTRFNTKPGSRQT